MVQYLAAVVLLCLSASPIIPPANASAPPPSFIYRTRLDMIGTGSPVTLRLDRGSHKGNLRIYRDRELAEVRVIDTEGPVTLDIETVQGERLRVVVVGGIRILR